MFHGHHHHHVVVVQVIDFVVVVVQVSAACAEWVDDLEKVSLQAGC
jgi:hypothetical protein